MPGDEDRARVDAYRKQRNARIEDAYTATARLNAALRLLRLESSVGLVEVVPSAIDDGTIDLRIVLERDAATPSSLMRLHEAPGEETDNAGN